MIFMVYGNQQLQITYDVNIFRGLAEFKESVKIV